MTAAWGPGWLEEKQRRDTARYGQGKRGYSLEDPRFLLRMVTDEREVFEPTLGRERIGCASALREAGNTYAHSFGSDAFPDAETAKILERIETLTAGLPDGGGAAQQARPQAEQRGALPPVTVRPERIDGGPVGPAEVRYSPPPPKARQIPVSTTNPQAFRTIGEALSVPVPPGVTRHVLIEPGRYPGFVVRRGTGVVVTAVAGPGSRRSNGGRARRWSTVPPPCRASR